MTILIGVVVIALANLVLGLQLTRERLTDLEAHEIGELVAEADRTARGEIPSLAGIARFHPHFLQAPDGRAYVPFTIVLQDVSGDAFSSVALYIRVARRGDRTTSADRGRRIGPTGVAVPVFAYDAAAAASAALRLMDRPDKPTADAYPFEAAHFTPVSWFGSAGIVRRAFVVRPGAYDVYIVIREREGSVPRGSAPRSVVLKEEVEVPDFPPKTLAMSSPILAETIQPIGRPLDPAEQIARPYALGTAEIVPALTPVFRQSDARSVVFLVYNAGTDAQGKPDVEVEYRFVRTAGGMEAPSGRPLTAQFNRDGLPKEFDVRAGHQIVPVQSLPLASFAPGDYRLEITVVDRVSTRTISRAVPFKVVP